VPVPREEVTDSGGSEKVLRGSGSEGKGTQTGRRENEKNRKFSSSFGHTARPALESSEEKGGEQRPRALRRAGGKHCRILGLSPSLEKNTGELGKKTPRHGLPYRERKT